MRKYTLKAYYGDIFFEFLVQDKSADCICFLPGFPSGNNYNELMYYLYGKGYHVFTIRYKGSYQSKGKFLDTNIVDDLIEFIEHLKKGIAISLWDLKEIHFKINNRYLFASSFGGAIACGLVSKIDFFNKMVLFAPVWDFSKHNKEFLEQDLQHLTIFTQRAYQNCYRFDFDDIQKELERFDEIKTRNYINKLNCPILVFHAINDQTVSINHSLNIAKLKPNIKIIKHNLGHGAKVELLRMFETEFDKFIKS